MRKHGPAGDESLNQSSDRDAITLKTHPIIGPELTASLAPHRMLRRLVVGRLLLLLLLLALLLPSATMAAEELVVEPSGDAADAAAAGPLARVVVVGARGKTGALVVQHLKEAGAGKVLAVARNTSGLTGDGVVKWAQGDVRDAQRMAELFEGASAVVFAASASQGWTLRGDNTPKHVDFEAVVRFLFGDDD